MSKTVCYWLVGRNNNTQAPAVAYDLHDAAGNVLKSDSHSIPLGCDLLTEARTYAAGFAQREGASSVVYDADSTECFGDC